MSLQRVMDKETVERICSGSDSSNRLLIPQALNLFHAHIAKKDLYIYSTDYNKARKFGKLLDRPFHIIYEQPTFIRDRSCVVILGIFYTEEQQERLENLISFLQTRHKIDIWRLVNWY